MPSQKIIEPPTNQVIKLDNVTCPYCRADLAEASTNEEHVIGKKFIPKGMLHGQWNLILKSCQKCNTKKSNLEDDISAITLAGLVWYNDHNELNELVLNEVRRKSKGSLSRKTNRKVWQSNEELKVEFSSTSNLRTKFSATAPPQIDESRSFQLASMQMAGFFYFITYDNKSKKGTIWPEGFYPIIVTPYRDWGNVTFKAFMSIVENWKHRWFGITANGFFKSIIRKHPSKECWSWALEWNKNYRLIGFFGSQKTAQDIVNSFPSIKMKMLSKGDGTKIRYRKEIELDEKDDILFDLNQRTQA